MKVDKTNSLEKAKISGGDVYLISIQLVFGFLLLGCVPEVGIQFFSIACAAYLFVLCSVIVRTLKRNISANDRKILLFGFLPICVVTALLTTAVWVLKY